MQPMKHWPMQWLRRIALMLALPLAAPALADGIGVVVLHGKWDSPRGNVYDLTRALEREGFLVAAPEMTWSGRRGYDKRLDEAMAEIDAAVKALRDKGATRVFVAGHSLGAAAAIRYGARGSADGLIALSPGHYPEGKSFQSVTSYSVAKAKQMVESGQGDEKGYFDDPNTGNRKKAIEMTARTYLDFLDPAGPMNFRQNALAVKPGLPVLWVVGEQEADGVKRLGKQAFDNLPQTPPPTFLELAGGHMETPTAARDQVIAWIKEHSK